MQLFVILFALFVVVFCEDEDSPPGDEFFSEIQKLDRDCFDLDSCIELTKFHTVDRSGIVECKSQKNFPPNKFLKYKEIECVAECWAHGGKYVTGNSLNDYLISETKKRLSQHDWLVKTPLLDELIGECTKWEIPERDPDKCNGSVLKSGWCIAVQIMLHTPKDKQRDPEHCAVLQGYLEKYRRLPQQKLWCHKKHSI